MVVEREAGEKLCGFGCVMVVEREAGFSNCDNRPFAIGLSN